MVTQIWEDTDTAYHAVMALIQGQLGLSYAGWHVRGAKVRRSRSDEVVAIIGYWPYRPTLLHDNEVRVSYPNPEFHCGSLVPEGLDDDRIELLALTMQVFVEQAGFRPEVRHRVDALEEQWKNLARIERIRNLGMAHVACDHFKLPISCLVVKRSRRSPQDYVEFWHSRSLPPLTTLEAIRRHFPKLHH